MKIHGYKGTYYEQVKEQKTPKTKLIKHLTDALLSPSTNHNLIKLPVSFNYDQLTHYLNHNIKNQWATIITTVNEKMRDELKRHILSFYQLISYFYGNKHINTILSAITITLIIDNDILIYGQTNNEQTILLNKTVLDCAFQKKMLNKWKKGWFSSSNFWHILIHELAHLIYFYDKKYYFDQVYYLKQFVKAKINNLASIANLRTEMLWKTIANSTYGQRSKTELLAEGFAYWILTPTTMRTKAWDFWNEFFFYYLTQIRERKN